MHSPNCSTSPRPWLLRNASSGVDFDIIPPRPTSPFTHELGTSPSKSPSKLTHCLRRMPLFAPISAVSLVVVVVFFLLEWLFFERAFQALTTQTSSTNHQFAALYGIHAGETFLENIRAFAVGLQSATSESIVEPSNSSAWNTFIQLYLASAFLSASSDDAITSVMLSSSDEDTGIALIVSIPATGVMEKEVLLVQTSLRCNFSATCSHWTRLSRGVDGMLEQRTIRPTALLEESVSIWILRSTSGMPFAAACQHPLLDGSGFCSGFRLPHQNNGLSLFVTIFADLSVLSSQFSNWKSILPETSVLYLADDSTGTVLATSSEISRTFPSAALIQSLSSFEYRASNAAFLSRRITLPDSGDCDVIAIRLITESMSSLLSPIRIRVVVYQPVGLYATTVNGHRKLAAGLLVGCILSFIAVNAIVLRAFVTWPLRRLLKFVEALKQALTRQGTTASVHCEPYLSVELNSLQEVIYQLARSSDDMLVSSGSRGADLVNEYASRELRHEETQRMMRAKDMFQSCA